LEQELTRLRSELATMQLQLSQQLNQVQQQHQHVPPVQQGNYR
jgi:hypothetical protein